MPYPTYEDTMSESRGIAVALGTARMLLETQNREHLRRQVVLVVPGTNPDGSVRNQADRLGNGRGIPAHEVHYQDRPPATAEGRAMRALVEEWIPDAHVDFHGLAGGRMGALLPYDANHAERRKSRRDISQMILQGVPTFERLPNDRDWTAALHLPVEETVRTLPQGMRFKPTIDRRATIRQVLWQDHTLEAGLWNQTMTAAGIVVTADVPEAPRRGQNRLGSRYEVPFKRHVEPPDVRPAPPPDGAAPAGPARQAPA